MLRKIIIFSNFDWPPRPPHLGLKLTPCLVVGWLIPLIIDSALPQRVSVLLRRIPASLMFDLPHLLPARWRAVQAHAGRRLQRLAFLQVAPGTCAAHNRRAPGYHEAILALPITAAHQPLLQSNRPYLPWFPFSSPPLRARPGPGVSAMVVLQQVCPQHSRLLRGLSAPLHTRRGNC